MGNVLTYPYSYGLILGVCDPRICRLQILDLHPPTRYSLLQWDCGAAKNPGWGVWKFPNRINLPGVSFEGVHKHSPLDTPHFGFLGELNSRQLVSTRAQCQSAHPESRTMDISNSRWGGEGRNLQPQSGDMGKSMQSPKKERNSVHPPKESLFRDGISFLVVHGLVGEFPLHAPKPNSTVVGG